MMQQHITIQCTLDDLRSLIADEVAGIIRPIIQEAVTPPQSRQLHTRIETARYLGISLPTLNEWTKSGKIIANRIGSRVRYYDVDIKAALKQIHSAEAIGR